MDRLKEIVIKTLNKNGFGHVVAVEERESQIKKIEYILVGLWILLSCLFIKDIVGVFLWLLMVLTCLFSEQILSLLYVYFVYRKGTSLRKVYSQSISRSIYKRLNISFFCLYFLSFILLSSWYISSSTLVMYANLEGIIQGGFPGFFIMDNLSKKKDRSLWGMIFNLWYSVTRGGKQTLSLFNSGIGFVIPGIALAFVVGAISQDFWQFISEISWIDLSIILCLVVFFILMPSSSSMARTLDMYIRDLNLDKDCFSVERLYRAVVRCSSDEEAKKILPQQFNVYSDCYSWKWKQPLHNKALTNLIDELKMRAKWSFGLGVILLFPATFFVLLILGNLFPNELISHWISESGVSNSASLSAGTFVSGKLAQSGNDWKLFFNNPVTKFSILSTFLLMTYFAVDYSKDGQKIFSNLRLGKDILNEWITLLCSYHVLHEEEFQYAFVYFYTTHGGFKPVYLHVLLLPNDADSFLAYRVAERAKELYESSIEYCFVMVAISEFFKSNIAIKSYYELESAIINNQSSMPTNNPKCWVGKNKKNSKMSIDDFLNLDEAFDWALNYFRMN